MKKLGRQYTLKGQLPVNTVRELQLFDGRFDTGYKVEELQICPSLPMENIEFQMILSTDTLSDVTTMDWGDNTQIGWAIWGAPLSSRFSEWDGIDSDNMIIQDLYLSCRGGTEPSFLNYMITLQKYDISEWRGALAWVRNQSQGAKT